MDSSASSASVAQHPVVAKVRAIEDDLNSYLIARRAEIRGAFLALAAQQHVFYLGNPGSGKCLTGDTLLVDADSGLRLTIAEAVSRVSRGEGLRVLALDEHTWKIVSRRVVAATQNDPQPVFELRTKLGRRIQASANHPFRTLNGWRRLADLEADVQIATIISRSGRKTPGLMADLTSSQILADLAESDVYWDEIKSIEPAGSEITYDLQVEDDNFIANDLVVHNSYLVSEVCRRIRGDENTFFPIEFNSFILREEIFGPISLRQMRENDSLARKYLGFLPSASVAQLDELWKAPPSLLNTLLRILNEREFRNDTEMIRSPLITAFATSNELPPTDRSLDALYDRILLRYESAPLKQTDDRKRASRLRLAKRAFEVEISSAADDLAAVRARKLAEADAVLVAASAARQAESEGQLRVLYSARLHSEEERVAKLPPEDSEYERRRVRDTLRREVAGEVAAVRDEEANRLARERADLVARSAADGLPKAVHHADSWLINNFGEYFSDEALIRGITDEGSMPALGIYDAADTRDLLRRVARWCAKHSYVANYNKFLTRRDLDTLYGLVLGVTFPAEVEAAFYRILDSLPSVRSVRRETDLRLVIAAQAVLEGRTSASVEDLAVMKHVLWDRRDDQKTVNEAVNKETIALERELEALGQTISSWEHALTDELDIDYSTYSSKLAQREHELNRYKAVLEAHPNSPELKAMLARAEKLYHDYELAVMGRTGAANLNPFDLE